jgi:hypothetical protein
LRRALLILITAAGFLTASCARKPPDGFRPPLADDPLQAQIDNWRRAHILSGAYGVAFSYADGDTVRLRADLLDEPGERARVDLSSDRGAEAVVTITPEFINLLNHREKYWIRETSSASINERMVGLPLPAQEAAALLAGMGFDPERFEHIYTDADAEGGVRLRLYHATAPLTGTGSIDAFGRLRSIAYSDSGSEQVVIAVQYLDFRHDADSGLIWPGRVEIDLPLRGESISLSARDVDIDNERVMSRLKRLFARLETGSRIHIEQVPPGAPLLYRNLKVYVEDTK